MKETPERKVIQSIRLDPEIYSEIKKYARQFDISVSQLIRDAIYRYLYPNNGRSVQLELLYEKLNHRAYRLKEILDQIYE